jgi:tetratricopeptide (TPR) repeat protein
MKRYSCPILALLCCLLLAAAGAGQYSPRLDAKTEFERGRAALKIGYPAAALQSFRKAVELDPDYVEALSELVVTAKAVPRWREGQPVEDARAADSTLRAVRGLYTAQAARVPQSAVYRWALGQLDDSETQEAAERYFRQAIAIDPGFAKSYLSLASVLAYRGDYTGAREFLRRIFELHPEDSEVVAAYAQRVVETDPAFCAKLAEELLNPSLGNPAGSELIAKMSAFERNLTARIGMLERLKVLYPPNEYEVTEWHMRFLFDAYNRTDPFRALALAQEMSRLMPARSEAAGDWQDLVQFADAMVVARTLVDRKDFAAAAARLNKTKPPYLISPDPPALLQAEIADASGSAPRAYQLLASAYAEQPGDALLPVLMRYGAKIKRTAAQVEEDVWALRLKKAKTFRGFQLTAYRDGKKVQLSDYRGRVVLLNFWYPGETNCREEFPRLQKMLDKYGPQGLTIITINIYPPEDAIAAIITSHYGFISLRVPDDEWAARANKIDRTPTDILIDRQGRALFRPAFWGYDPQHTFELEIEAILGRNPKN